MYNTANISWQHASRGSLILVKSSNLSVFEPKEESFNQIIDNESFHRSTPITTVEIMQAEELKIRWISVSTILHH